MLTFTKRQRLTVQADGEKYGCLLYTSLVHTYGKKAYGFQDDSWVGVEPWGKRFKDFGFDGLIKMCIRDRNASMLVATA